MLVLLMMLSLLPINAMAIGASPIISINSTNVIAGSKASVDVSIQNNPGILGAVLTLSYDDGLTLTEASAGNAFGALTLTTPKVFQSGLNYIWDAQDIADDQIKDGTILHLTFDVDSSVESGTPLNVSISYIPGDIVDVNMNPVDVQIANGLITVIDYIPGDLDNNGRHNSVDVTLLRRYIADKVGYGVSILEAAGDVDASGRLNSVDVTLLRRYIADKVGYGVKLKPSPLNCSHSSLIEVSAKPYTCTEDGNIAYWRCKSCSKYFRDAAGTQEILLADTVLEARHTVEVIPATDTMSAGKKCSACDIILEAPQPIEDGKYYIAYDVANGDLYLRDLINSGELNNTNPDAYNTNEATQIKDLTPPSGYRFLGWYDRAGVDGAVKITSIPAGEVGDKTIYAHWEVDTYTVVFDSPDFPYDPVKWPVNESYKLPVPTCFGYTFVGWSDDDGFLIDHVDAGTTGTIEVHANWTSNRNKGVSYSSYGDPGVIVDEDNGQILFLYSIGRIENVPLNVVLENRNSDGFTYNSDVKYSMKVNEAYEDTIVKMVSNATTKSSGWTLSEDWNEAYETGSEQEETVGKSQERTDKQGNTTGGKYFISNSEAGESYLSVDSGGTRSNSARITTEDSVAMNKSFDYTGEMYCDAKLSAENKTEVSAGIGLPIEGINLNLGAKNTTTIGAEVSNGRKDTLSLHADESTSSYIGTDTSHGSSSYFDVTTSNKSSWNSTEGYEKSYEQMQETAITSAINTQLSQKTTMNISKALGGSSEENFVVGNSTSTGEEYTTALKYGNETTEEKTEHCEWKANELGNYRIVTAGKIEVFAIVGYDIASDSYYTVCYSVMTDDRYPFLDFSRSTTQFDDCENAVIPFEVPIEVFNYVSALTNGSNDLAYDEYGILREYSGTKEDASIVIPQYRSQDNGKDGTKIAQKVTEFDADTFSGNTDIMNVVLPAYVTDIPDGAFEGCTNLQTVVALGVTTIGNNAFKGCVNLDSFMVDDMVTEIGENAFQGVDEIKVRAANLDVAKAVLNSGAKRITLDIRSMTETLDNMEIEMDESTEYFALLCSGETYSNLTIKSDATETYLSNLTFVNNDETPLQINSEHLTLNRIKVQNAPGFALILKNEATNMAIFGDVKLNSKGDNAILSRATTLKRENAYTYSTLTTTGGMLVWGEVSDTSFMLRINGSKTEAYTPINEQDYYNYLSPITVLFDAGDGQCDQSSKKVYRGSAYGALPVPTREYYGFEGWQDAEGNAIDADTICSAEVNVTLYAKWKANSSTLSFNATGGSIDTTSKIILVGQPCGELPVPTRDYYTFLGWYDAESGGSAVGSGSVFYAADDITLYAHWKLNDLSGWVLESAVPSDAASVENKWSYTKTTIAKSTNTSMDGFTQIGSEWIQSGNGAFNYASFPSGFDTGNWYYQNWNRSPYSAYENATSKRTVSTYWGGYLYWHWMYSTGSAGTATRAIYHKYGTGPDNGYVYKYFFAFDSTKGDYSSDKYYCNSQNITNYIVNDQHTSNAECGGATRWFRFDYHTCSYTDYVKQFTYRKIENLESNASISASDTISNVQHWVRYRSK